VQNVFQVDLRGMIDLLSEHLYSGPEVFVRELLQNSVDAITARRNLEPGFTGSVVIHVRDGQQLEFIDDGVGLTASEVQEFLATIGRSSKRGSSDFIGQFGIGLLSCFVVSDEIELQSLSLKSLSLKSASSETNQAVVWRGFANGEYNLETGTRSQIGSLVRLKAKAGREDVFTFERVLELCRHYGGLLPFPIEIREDDRHEIVNPLPAPWTLEFDSSLERDAAFKAFGTRLLGVEPFDAFPIQTEAGSISGLAFVLPWTPSLGARGRHQVYVRNMLLSEDSENLVPEWAFFVKCVLNSDSLRPNAARDALYENETLEQAQLEIGESLRNYLIGLAEHNPTQLKRFIGMHYLSIKALSSDDDDFFALFSPWLPFETSYGRMTLPEFLDRIGSQSTGSLKHNIGTLPYVTDAALFQQASQVLSAKGEGVINAIYTYDAGLIEKFARLQDLEAHAFLPHDLISDFREPNAEERRQSAVFSRVANQVLSSFSCEAEIAKFPPRDLPALYVPFDTYFVRELKRARQNIGGLWGDVLEDVSKSLSVDLDAPNAQLQFNLENTLVQRLITLPEGPLLERMVGMVYVQALLQGHHPLGPRELKLLTEGLLELISLNTGSAAIAKGLN
jgi:molecular chaperone HtpG